MITARSILHTSQHWLYRLKSVYRDEVEVLFKSPTKLLEAVRQDLPHIVGLSSYSWNVEINRLGEDPVFT